MIGETDIEGLRMPGSLFARLRARYGQPVRGLTRREFLGASLAAGTALLLSSGRGGVTQGAANAGRSVIVIGAGFSGLAAAYEFLAAGYDVTISGLIDNGTVVLVDRL